MGAKKSSRILIVLCGGVFLSIGLLFLTDEVSAEETAPFQIRIVYPPERMSLPALERTFVYGFVSPPHARVLVNGLDSPVSRSASGAWLAMVPVQPGKFDITAKAVFENGVETSDVCRVTVAKAEAAAGDSPKKQFDIGDQAVHKPPAEREWKPFRVGRISEDTVYLRSGPNVGDEQAGFELPLPKNVLVTIVGQVDKTLHVRLSDLESVWVDAYAVKLLPKQSPRPESFINAWTVRREPRSTFLYTTLQELLPYRMTVSPDGLMLTLKIYGGVSNTDWIHFSADDPWIRHVRWSHPLQGVYQLEVDLRRPVWGFDVRYEKRKLILELRDPPPMPEETYSSARGKFRRESPILNYIENLKVCIDPGHPPMGSTSPHGTSEHVVNWRLAQKLREALEERGAEVVMTRQEGETLPLPDRVVRARQAEADLFISIHTNAVAPDGNPFERNGYSVYFFQPHSQPLAEAVHTAFREQIPLRDDGLHFGNLHVLRQTSMPSVLVECAYLIWPPEEELLLDPDFQSRCAIAITSGIEMFLRTRQNAP